MQNNDTTFWSTYVTMYDVAKQFHYYVDRFTPPASFVGTRDGGRLLVFLKDNGKVNFAVTMD